MNKKDRKIREQYIVNALIELTDQSIKDISKIISWDMFGNRSKRDIDKYLKRIDN